MKRLIVVYMLSFNVVVKCCEFLVGILSLDEAKLSIPGIKEIR